MFVGHLWSSISHMMQQGRQQMNEDVGEKLEDYLRLLPTERPHEGSSTMEQLYAVISVDEEMGDEEIELWIGVLYRDENNTQWHAWMGNVYCGVFDTKERAANNVCIAYYG